jgi:hypothetical protein
VPGSINRVRIRRNTIGFDWDNGQNYKFSCGMLLAAGRCESFIIHKPKFVATKTYDDGEIEGYINPTNNTFAVSVMSDLNGTTLSDTNNDPEKFGGAFFAAYKNGPLDTGDETTPITYGILGRQGNLVISPNNTLIDIANNWLRQASEFESPQGDINLDLKVDEEDFFDAFGL